MKGENVIIFGASNLGITAKQYLSIDYTIINFCDNAKEKWGEKIDGIEIISPENLRKICNELNICVVIASMYYNDIYNQLLKLGISEHCIKIFESTIKSYNTINHNSFVLQNYSSEILNKEKNISKFNVHFMPDNFYSNTFIKYVNSKFNIRDNIFIIYNKTCGLRYIDSDKYSNVFNLHIRNDISEIIPKIAKCNKLFIHFLSDAIAEVFYKYNILSLANKSYWVIWGGDYYPYLNLQLFEDQTKKIVPYDKGYKMKGYSIKYREEFLKNIDYILCGSVAEYNLIKNRFDIKANLKWFRYEITTDFKYLQSLRNKNEDWLKQKYAVDNIILLGNSATYENNHLDMLYKLKEFNDSNFAIICPLSYGDDICREKIIEEGKRLFQNKFIPLLNFMEGEEYFGIMNQADIVIMNHIRQQAEGNILAALLLGKKVYINSKSTVYQYYKHIGVEVFDINDVKESKELFFNDINIDLNCKKIINAFDDNKIKNNIDILLNE